MYSLFVTNMQIQNLVILLLVHVSVLCQANHKLRLTNGKLNITIHDLRNIHRLGHKFAIATFICTSTLIFFLS